MNSRLSRRTFLKGTGAAAVGAAAGSPFGASAASNRSTLAPRRVAQNGDSITAWMFGGVPGQLEWYQELVAQFEDESGITVDYQERDWARQREDILAALTAGAMPDVIRVHNKDVAEFGEPGVLKALEEFDDFDDVAADFLPGYLATTEHEGQHYGLPEGALVFIMALNQSMLDSAGVEPPTNWDEFRASAIELSRPEDGIYGYSIPGGVNLDTSYRWIPWLYKAGGRVLSEDWTEATFNDEAGVAALDMLLELQEAEAIPSGNAAYAFAENADLWGSELIAMSTEGPWWQNVMAEQYNMDTAKLTIAPIPALDQPIGPAPPATLLDMSMMALIADGNTEPAWEFVKFMRSTEHDRQFADPDRAGQLPVTTAGYEDDVEWGFIGRDVYLSEAEAVEVWPNHPSITEIQLAIAEGLNAAFAGTATAQEALDRAAANVNDILED